MRSFASGEFAPGVASAARLWPDGGEPTVSAIAASAAALPKRLTGLAVEEVHARDVDGDRDLLGQAQGRVSRELGDEVRPRGDDALCARRCLRDLLVLPLADGKRVDLEIDHRFAAERLDEL